MPIDGRQLLLENLDTINRAVAFTCRRSGIVGADAEDFASSVKLKLLENDCAILRSFERRSSFSSFIAVVVQRMLSDERNHRWGKWHASSEAKRIGEIGVELEKLIVRDGRPFEEALPLLTRAFPDVTREQLLSLAARLPNRAPRRRFVDLEEAALVARTADDEAEKTMLESERDALSARASEIIRELLRSMSEDDQLIIQLRFETGMSVAQIARALHIEQKLLYRRLDRHMHVIRAALAEAGIDAEAAREILEHHAALDLDLGNPVARPSLPTDGESDAAHEEISG